MRHAEAPEEHLRQLPELFERADTPRFDRLERTVVSDGNAKLACGHQQIESGLTGGMAVSTEDRRSTHQVEQMAVERRKEPVSVLARDDLLDDAKFDAVRTRSTLLEPLVAQWLGRAHPDDAEVKFKLAMRKDRSQSVERLQLLQDQLCPSQALVPILALRPISVGVAPDLDEEALACKPFLGKGIGALRRLAIHAVRTVSGVCESSVRVVGSVGPPDAVPESGELGSVLDAPLVFHRGVES